MELGRQALWWILIDYNWRKVKLIISLECKEDDRAQKRIKVNEYNSRLCEKGILNNLHLQRHCNIKLMLYSNSKTMRSESFSIIISPLKQILYNLFCWQLSLHCQRCFHYRKSPGDAVQNLKCNEAALYQKSCLEILTVQTFSHSTRKIKHLPNKPTYKLHWNALAVVKRSRGERLCICLPRFWHQYWQNQHCSCSDDSALHLNGWGRLDDTRAATWQRCRAFDAIKRCGSASFAIALLHAAAVVACKPISNRTH